MVGKQHTSKKNSWSSMYGTNIKYKNFFIVKKHTSITIFTSKESKIININVHGIPMLKIHNERFSVQLKITFCSISYKITFK